MADYTPNYNLKKPLEDESYNVEDQNLNMDIIDLEVKKVNEDIVNYKLDNIFQIPVIMGTQIQLVNKSNTSRLYFKLEAELIGNITISTDGGVSEKPLVDTDGVQVTQLEKGFVEVVAHANFFILRNRGISSADRQALINAVNRGLTNEGDLKDIMVSTLNTVNTEGAKIQEGALWGDILNNIPNIKTGKEWKGGTINTSSDMKTYITASNSSVQQYYINFDFRALSFVPSVIIINSTIISDNLRNLTTWKYNDYYQGSDNSKANCQVGGSSLKVPYEDNVVSIPFGAPNINVTWVAYE